MRTDLFFSFFDGLVFLGVFQGIFLSWFFIRDGYQHKNANIFQGVLILVLSLAIFEEFLNNTGLIVRVLEISNFAEPFNFAFASLFFLYVKNSLFQKNAKTDWLHLLPVLLWAAYMTFYFIQSNDFKYNSYVDSKHPDWDLLPVTLAISDDPAGIRRYINDITAVHFSVYMIFSVRLIVLKLREKGQSFFKVEDGQLKMFRNAAYHFLMIIVIFVFVKLYFGRDIGDSLIGAYVAIMFFSTTYQIINHSDYFKQPHLVFSLPDIKYKKSALRAADVSVLLSKIENVFEEENYHLDNMASLSGLAKKTGASTHHVSQVINTELNKSFFELLAYYRVETAKTLMLDASRPDITIEELAEEVGYNSKSAFNKAFKKYAGYTPSEFRKNNAT
jgi:AraC-like DNA-binding protein